MSDRPFLSLTLIAKDEKHNVKRCLDSVWGAVDEVVVGDTGSTDGTVEAFERYAKSKGEPDKLKVVHVEWTDDFSAARQAVDDAATGEWLTWMDCDDSVNGLINLRKLAEEASDDVLAYFCQYSYAQDPTGNTISELWRERVVRNTGLKWTGRLHEHKLFTGGTVIKVDPRTAEWVHHRNHEQRTGERNLRILEKWDEDEPNDPRILSSLALEYMGAERHKDASDTFARFLECPGEPQDRRAQAVRHMCVMLMLQNRVKEAREWAFRSLSEFWLWADTHLTLAEVEQTQGRPDVALMHAQTALTLGKPDTLLIVNPLQYTAHPRALMAVCLAQMDRFEEAVRMAEECLQIAPTYQLAAQHVPLWRGQLKKQNALQTWLAAADVLVEVGEVVKARELLSAAPYFVADEPRLIAKRGEVERVFGERLRSPVAVVDGAADELVKRYEEMAT